MSGAGNLLNAKSAHGRKSKGEPRERLVRGAAIFLLCAIIAALGGAGYIASAKDGTIVRGVSAGAVELGGKTGDEASHALEDAAARMRLVLVLRSERVVIDPSASSGIATYAIADTVKNALAIGRGKTTLRALIERLNAGIIGKNLPLSYTLDRGALANAIRAKLPSGMKPAKDASFVIDFDETGAPVVSVSPEERGASFDIDAIADAADSRLAALSAAPVPVAIDEEPPPLLRRDVAPLVPDVIRAVSRAPLMLTVKNETWIISKRLLADWIIAAPTDGDPKARLALDPEKVTAYLENRGAPLAVEPVDAVFQMKNGKVSTFAPSVDGEKIDADVGRQQMETAVFADDAPTGAIEVPFAVVPPAVDTETASSPYGIKEIIGVGETNFMGSPVNRRKNIAVGAASVNGTLVAPDQEFSLLKTIGPVDDAHGYLKELVIKENKTTPEFGGGLCQIGTTTFRAVLATGLPVTVRQNHSYRVPYYERDGAGNTIGPGKDATIYNPAPDFRFVNDTGHEVLITTAIKGDRLTFTFWGVKDGRKAEQTVARVYNIVPPPPSKRIETLNIPPGTTKCTEHAHPGSDADFTYTVTYPDGTVKTKVFHSHYKPWGEVCLIGVDPKDHPELTNAVMTTVPSADAVGAAGN